MPKVNNWKTTSAGIGAILVAIGTAFPHIATGDWSVLPQAIPAIVAGVGLIFAHDAVK